jgi:hypothetical protein
MGQKLIRYYDFAKQKGGLSLQVKLAMKTSMSQPQALTAPDSPDNLRRFYTTLVELVGNDPGIPKPV